MTLLDLEHLPEQQGLSIQTEVRRLVRNELYVLRCLEGEVEGAEATQETLLGSIQDHLSQELWNHLMNIEAAISIPCGLSLVAMENPLPIGRYARGQRLCWNNRVATELQIRHLLTGPFMVLGATEYADQYQGAYFETEEDDDLICAVYEQRTRRQRELLLLDELTQIALVAPPGFFRYVRSPDKTCCHDLSASGFFILMKSCVYITRGWL